MADHTRYTDPLWRRAGNWLLTGLAGIPGSLWGGLRAVGGVVRGLGTGLCRRLAELWEALRHGDAATRLSFLVMGTGCLWRGQWLQGLLYLAAQLWYILYMIGSGAALLGQYVTLGTSLRGEVWDEELQIWIYTQPDNSLEILLFGTVTILLTLGFL